MQLEVLGQSEAYTKQYITIEIFCKGRGESIETKVTEVPRG